MIDFTLTPSADDINVLTKGINQEITQYGSAHSFAFFIKDDKGRVIAGCNGSIIFGVIYTDQLWIHPSHRKKGWGKNLMDKVHQYGLKEGCFMATVSTMSFQDAQPFYEKLGYYVDFERKGYANGSSCLFLKKEL